MSGYDEVDLDRLLGLLDDIEPDASGYQRALLTRLLDLAEATRIGSEHHQTRSIIDQVLSHLQDAHHLTRLDAVRHLNEMALASRTSWEQVAQTILDGGIERQMMTRQGDADQHPTHVAPNGTRAGDGHS